MINLKTTHIFMSEREWGETWPNVGEVVCYQILFMCGFKTNSVRCHGEEKANFRQDDTKPTCKKCLRVIDAKEKDKIRMGKPMRYRKKPVVIEAIQYKSPDDIVKMIEHWGDDFTDACVTDAGVYEIETLEGNHRISEGDYVIKGVKGEFYPCKPDIFQLSYEIAEQ